LRTKGRHAAAVASLVVLIIMFSLAGAVVHAPTYIAENGDKKGDSEKITIIEHKVSTQELEELKLKHGVWEEGRNYNLVIDGHGTGLRPPTDNEWAEIADKAYVVDSILLDQLGEPPPSIDHSVEPWFPPIGNQDGEGSCTTWAVGYYMKTFQEAKEHEWDLSDATWEGGYYGHPTPAYQNRIISPDFIYHLVNGGVDLGSSFYGAINLVCSIGASSWEKMPYDPIDHSSWPSEEAWREAPLYRGNSSGYEEMSINTDAGLTNLKNWIASDHLAVIAVDADKYSGLTSQDIWTLNYVPSVLNHANTIVGYNDTISYTELGQTRYGAFKIANSWGDEGTWEKVPDGFYWISYEAMKQRVQWCSFYQDRIGYDPSLLASFEMDHSKRAECDILIGMGNTSDPVATKSFSDPINGGNYPFCTNNVALDITEFADTVPTTVNQPFFIRVLDKGEPYAHSSTHCWYSDGTSWSWFSFYQTFDMPETGATLNFWSYYEIEKDWDYGYLEVHDLNTDEWCTLPGLATVSTLPERQDNPNCPPEYEPTAYYDAGRWNAFTGFGDLHEEEMNLTAFAGHTIQLYFTYWTDRYTLEPGWYIDDITIPEIGFFDDVESGLDGWTVYGGWYIATPSPPEPTTGTLLSFSIEHYQGYSSETLKATSTSQDAPALTVDLAYVFAFAIAGDINGDRNVDYDDLAITVVAYGSSNSEPAYEPDADFNKDDNVDCHDLIILGRNYGKTAT